MLFFHRDAEAQDPELRRREIAHAVHSIATKHIPVVPVRMTEAWLLWNEAAIRWAAGNPNGRDSLKLPDVRKLEDVHDPKKVLHQAVIVASGLGARRGSRLSVEQRVRLIPNYIDDYSPLRALPAFRTLQEDVAAVVELER